MAALCGALYCKRCGDYIGIARRTGKNVDVWLTRNCPHQETKNADWDVHLGKSHPAMKPNEN